MPRATHAQLVSAARTIALEASVNAGRIETALHAISAADGYLRSASGGGITGGSISDPTGRTAERELDPTKRTADTASADRAEIERLIKRMLNDSADIAKILRGWIPDERKQLELRQGSKVTNDDIWCTNHARYGIDQPRADGRTLCDFCEDFKQRPDNPQRTLPGRWILDKRQRVARLNSADFANEFRLQTEQRESERAKAKTKGA